MFIQNIENKEPIIKEFYTWLFDDSRIINKNVNLQKEIDLSLTPFYSDPNIYYPKQIADFFETKAMKRLGRISQLALAVNEYTNPEWKKYIEDNNLKLNLFACLIKMAGHDIGHFPLSHVFEESIYNKHDAHEVIGKKIILEDEEIQQLLSSISPFLNDVIKELFEKKTFNLSFHDEGNFDVDRLDYISRDSLYIGVPFNSKSLLYKKVAIKTDLSGKPILKEDFSLSKENNGHNYIDVYDYSSLEYIETFLHTRFNNYKKIYMSKKTKIAESAIKAFMDIFTSEKQTYGIDLYNYLLYLKNTDINSIDINEFLKWDDIYFYSQIIEIAKNHSDVNVRNLACMIIPSLKPFLNVIYSHLNVKNCKKYSEKDMIFLKTIKKIIYGNDEFSRNIKNPNFLYENTFIVNNINDLPNDFDKNLINTFSYRLIGYNEKSPIYVSSSNGKIYELSHHPERTTDWGNLHEDLNLNYIYIPYLKFFKFSDSQITEFSNLLETASSQYKQKSSDEANKKQTVDISNLQVDKNQTIDMNPLQANKKQTIDMSPLQIDNNIEDIFLEL